MLVALHIPDGFLSPGISLLGWLVASALVGYAIRATRQQFGEKQVPLTGVLAAFIFAAQAVNFPIAVGTSGHLLGAALAGILLGPWAGVLVMTAVIVVQGLVFQDGGLLVMGWNVLNMGILPVLTGSMVYRLGMGLLGENPRAGSLVVFSAAWLSVETGAVATAVALASSETTPLYLGLPALVVIYAVVGIGEGIITAATLSFLRASRPELLRTGRAAAGQAAAAVVFAGLLVALSLALLAPFASVWPDGLERVAETQGFSSRALAPWFELFPDYSVAFLGESGVATALAVAVGTLLVFGLVFAIGQFATRAGE